MTEAASTVTAVTEDQPPASTKTGEEGVHLPGGFDIWVFVLGDLIIFSAYFVIFMIYRHQEPHVFLASQRHLSLTIAVINTLVLLASSRFIALAVLAARASDQVRAIRLVWCSGACGALFIVIKAFEWYHEIHNGHTLASNNFFMFYFVLTGVHVLHVVLGLIFLSIVTMDLRNPKLRRVSVVEAGATYWHMVDLLWIIIFALLYVMR
jgi:nitric oxide reductase NorE protein